MKIQKKLLLSVLLTVILAFASTIIIVSYDGTSLLEEKAIQVSGEMAQHYGFAIRNSIENKIAVVQQLNYMVSSLKKNKITDREVYNHLLHDLLENNKDILGMWVIYEPNALDGKDQEYVNKVGHDKTGRYIPYFNRGAGEIKLESLTDYDKEGAGDYYLLTKKNRKLTIIEPYVYKVNGEDVLMTSIALPIIENGEVVGVSGVDVSLKEYAKFCENIRPFETGYINLASNNGLYIYSRDGNLIGKNIKENPNLPQEAKNKLLEMVKAGGSLDLIDKEHGFLRAIRPINITGVDAPWTMSVTVPINKINQESQRLTKTAFISAIISLILLSVLLFF